MESRNASTNYAPATADAKDSVNYYVIRNRRGSELVVADRGAAVVSLKVPDRYGNNGDVVLGYEDKQDYLEDEYYLGTVVGRYANRISGEAVDIDGVTYRLHTKEGGYHLHGGEVGFNKRQFKATTFESNGLQGIEFNYTSPHLEEGFPGQLQLRVIYTLDDNNAWTVEYRAISDRTTLLNLTQHAYFNLTGDPSASITGHQLRINSKFYLPVNGLQVPTGELAEVAGTVFDFNAFKEIGRDINNPDPQLVMSGGYDHSFVLEERYTQHMKTAAEVYDPISGRKLEVSTMQPAVHFYSGNYLQGLKGKNGAIYNARSGFCLETQHFPDAPRHPHFPSTILKAGEEFYSKTIFRFSVVD